MSTQVTKSLNLSYSGGMSTYWDANSDITLNGSTTAIGSYAARTTSSSYVYMTAKSAAMQELFPNDTAHPTSMNLDMTVFAALGVTGHWKFMVDGTSVYTHSYMGALSDEYRDDIDVSRWSSAVLSALRSSEIKIGMCSDSTTLLSGAGIEGGTISLTFNRYDFLATADTGIASVTVSSATGFDGDEITFTATLESGYIFDGWYDGSTKVSSSLTYTMTVNGADVSLTSKTASHTCTVTFEVQGHGTAPASQTISSGGTATRPTDPTATGYTFGGWYEEAACTTLFDFTTAITSNKTLYAKWTAISYSIAYDLDGGSVATANPTTYTIETASFTLNNPTKTNYDFDGWTGTGLSAETLTVTIPQGSTGDRSYTANYSAQVTTHTVTFVMNGHGTNPGAQTVTDGGTATEPTAPTEAHYTFGGWYADSALETVFDFSTAIYEDKTIYAKWTELATYTLTFDMQSHGTQITSQTKHTDESFTRPTDPTAEGYTFGGWYEESACTNQFDFAQTPSQNVTAYAKWTVRTVYTVTFAMNGHGTQVPSQSIESGGTATRPTDPAEDGYTFKNWYADSALTTLFDFTAAVTSNKTAYAKWEKDTVLDWNGNRNHETYTFTRVDFSNFMELENYDYITGGSIEYADDAELKVTGSFPFTGEELPDTSDLLRVKYSFYDDNQIYSETTLGTFVVSYAELTMKDTQSGLLSSGTLSASSVLSVLQEKAVGVPTTIAAGSQAVYEAGLLIRECGLHFESDDSSFTLTSDHVFDSGTDYLEMVNWLLEAASFRDAYPDTDGIIQLRSSFSDGSFFEFSNDENSIVYLEIEASNEWQSSPNVVRLLYNTDEDCVAAWARNLSGSKSSLSERGNREITYYEEVSDLGTVDSYKDALIAQAEELLREKSSDVEYATFQHAFKPVQLYDTVLLNYDEKSWEGAVTNITVDLSPGTKTQTKLKRELSSAIEIDSDGAIYREEEEND